MALDIQAATIVPPTTSFSIMVPGHQQWHLRSIVATVHRGAGGTPNRSYLLQISDGTNVVAQTPAADAGAQPGSGTITWADAPTAVLAAGLVMSSVGPLPRLVLPPGFVITCTIVNPAIADTWNTGLAWFDYRESGR